MITHCPRPWSDVVSARSERSGDIEEQESPVKYQVVDRYDRELRPWKESSLNATTCSCLRLIFIR